MFVVFAGVVPQEFAFIAARFGLVRGPHHLDFHHPLQRMQARAREGDGRRVCIGPLPPHQLGIAGAADVARTGEQSAGLL